jgi:hypothetical protein
MNGFGCILVTNLFLANFKSFLIDIIAYLLLFIYLFIYCANYKQMKAFWPETNLQPIISFVSKLENRGYS